MGLTIEQNRQQEAARQEAETQRSVSVAKTRTYRVGGQTLTYDQLPENMKRQIGRNVKPDRGDAADSRTARVVITKNGSKSFGRTWVKSEFHNPTAREIIKEYNRRVLTGEKGLSLELPSGGGGLGGGQYANKKYAYQRAKGRAILNAGMKKLESQQQQKPIGILGATWDERWNNVEKPTLVNETENNPVIKNESTYKKQEPKIMQGPVQGPVPPTNPLTPSFAGSIAYNVEREQKIQKHTEVSNKLKQANTLGPDEVYVVSEQHNASVLENWKNGPQEKAETSHTPLQLELESTKKNAEARAQYDYDQAHPTTLFGQGVEYVEKKISNAQAFLSKDPNVKKVADATGISSGLGFAQSMVTTLGSIDNLATQVDIPKSVETIKNVKEGKMPELIAKENTTTRPITLIETSDAKSFSDLLSGKSPQEIFAGQAEYAKKYGVATMVGEYATFLLPIKMPGLKAIKGIEVLQPALKTGGKVASKVGETVKIARVKNFIAKADDVLTYKKTLRAAKKYEATRPADGIVGYRKIDKNTIAIERGGEETVKLESVHKGIEPTISVSREGDLVKATKSKVPKQEVHTSTGGQAKVPLTIFERNVKVKNVNGKLVRVESEGEKIKPNKLPKLKTATQKTSKEIVTKALNIRKVITLKEAKQSLSRSSISKNISTARKTVAKKISLAQDVKNIKKSAIESLSIKKTKKARKTRKETLITDITSPNEQIKQKIIKFRYKKGEKARPVYSNTLGVVITSSDPEFKSQAKTLRLNKQSKFSYIRSNPHATLVANVEQREKENQIRLVGKGQTIPLSVLKKLNKGKESNIGAYIGENQQVTRFYETSRGGLGRSESFVENSETRKVFRDRKVKYKDEKTVRSGITLAGKNKEKYIGVGSKDFESALNKANIRLPESKPRTISKGTPYNGAPTRTGSGIGGSAGKAESIMSEKTKNDILGSFKPESVGEKRAKSISEEELKITGNMSASEKKAYYKSKALKTREALEKTFPQKIVLVSSQNEEKARKINEEELKITGNMSDKERREYYKSKYRERMKKNIPQPKNSFIGSNREKVINKILVEVKKETGNMSEKERREFYKNIAREKMKKNIPQPKNSFIGSNREKVINRMLEQVKQETGNMSDKERRNFYKNIAREKMKRNIPQPKNSFIGSNREKVVNRILADVKKETGNMSDKERRMFYKTLARKRADENIPKIKNSFKGSNREKAVMRIISEEKKVTGNMSDAERKAYYKQQGREEFKKRYPPLTGDRLIIMTKQRKREMEREKARKNMTNYLKSPSRYKPSKTQDDIYNMRTGSNDFMTEEQIIRYPDEKRKLKSNTIQIPSIKPKQSSSNDQQIKSMTGLKTNLDSATDQKQKQRNLLENKQKEREETKRKLDIETRQRLKIKADILIRTKQKIVPVQKQKFDLTQKQEMKLDIPKEKFPKPERKPPTGLPILPNTKKGGRRRKVINKNAADFLGADSESSLIGLTGRTDITYGRNRTARLSAKDERLRIKAGTLINPASVKQPKRSRIRQSKEVFFGEPKKGTEPYIGKTRNIIYGSGPTKKTKKNKSKAFLSL